MAAEPRLPIVIRSAHLRSHTINNAQLRAVTRVVSIAPRCTGRAAHSGGPCGSQDIANVTEPVSEASYRPVSAKKERASSVTGSISPPCVMEGDNEHESSIQGRQQPRT